MRRMKKIQTLIAAAALLLAAGPAAAAPPYPASTAIDSVTFDMGTVRNLAPGSDNWGVTWADDDNQYTTWGDGGGFGGTDSSGRVSLGFGRVAGTKSSYTGTNVWGGASTENPAAFSGKSYGLISIGGTLYMWRTGDGSDGSAYTLQELYASTDHAATWTYTGIGFTPSSFPASNGFFAPTFLQFGRDYAGARDNYVYIYAPEIQDGNWNVQTPGEISLIRVPKDQLDQLSAYEYFTGLDGSDNPTWSANLADRTPVFADAANGVMRTSVSYNAGLGRYLLITQQVDRNKAGGARIGIYDAPEPWGPWTTVLYEDPWAIGLQNGSKTVYWNFSNKWLSADGRQFVLVYTGPGSDQWGTVEGTFTLPSSDTTPPDAPSGVAATLVP
jgi:hypothetical protein